jgi:uncharacterized membrane protein
MSMLIAGLLIFLGVHSVRVVAEDWRTQVRQRVGENTFKGVYSVLSLLGFMLIIWGYGAARLEPVALWGSPTWTRHLAALITLPAFVLLVAAYVPGNGIKARVHHPMVLGVKTWALAHLVANNTLADLLLFGGFLVWSVFSYRAARQRDRVSQVVYPPGKASMTAVTVVVGVLAWAGFAFWAHAAWIGVRPFG